MTNTNVFISLALSLVTIILDGRPGTGDNDRSQKKHRQLYIQFYKTYNNQMFQDGKPACTKLVLHVTITLREKDFFSNSISLATTTLSWILDEHVLSFTRM